MKLTSTHPLLGLLAVSCAGGTEPEEDGPLTVRVAVEAGTEPPEGVASLSRRETSGDLAEDGTVLVPAVSSKGYGDIEYGVARHIEVPEGWVVLDVIGFESSGLCDDMSTPYGGCSFSEWTGTCFVWVGESSPTENFGDPDLAVAFGEEATLHVLVQEGCECPD